VTIVQCRWRHTVAMTNKGNFYSWDRGTSGQLGHGDAVDKYKSFFADWNIVDVEQSYGHFMDVCF
jgi:alpha-tubulin suppressor-like RCC1 family protein